MKACIITIGDELLIGQVLDTNSAWLATELTALGFEVSTLLSIADTKEAIISALDIHLPTSNLILFTGGLGPTKDDITKKVLAHYFQSELVFSEAVLADVESFLKARGGRMNALNREQALFPDKALLLHNHQGTAPGMWFEQQGKVVISLPGVPSEMKGIYKDYIAKALQKHFQLPERIYKTVMFTGIAEAHLAEKIADWEENLPHGLKLAYLPSPGIVRLRLGMSGPDKRAIQTQLEEQIYALQQIVGKYIYGYDNESLEEVVGNSLLDKQGTLATAESCTGGSIAQKITAIPGCSAWYKGGTIAYDNSVKQQVLGVKEHDLKQHGAVSREVVEQMVLGAQKVFQTDYAIATSGIAGPGGGSEEKPVGTVWIAVAGPDFLHAQKFQFGKERDINIRRSTLAAFNLMRLWMTKTHLT